MSRGICWLYAIVLFTSAIQALVPANRVDLVGPIPQAFRLGLGSSGAIAIIVPFAVAAVSARAIANSSVLFTATSRMPMVAGWDSLLPGWFARLHSRYGTPVNSILFIGVCALLFAAAGMINVGEQEAFQLVDNAAGIFYGLTYLALFALPVLGLRGTLGQSPVWLRMLAVAGFATTLLYVVLSALPYRSRGEPTRVRAQDHGAGRGGQRRRRRPLPGWPRAPLTARRVRRRLTQATRDEVRRPVTPTCAPPSQARQRIRRTAADLHR